MPKMPSSDSDTDEDCYGNVAKKLQCLKKNYRAEKPIVPVATVGADWSPIVFPTEKPTSTNCENSSEEDSIFNLLEEVPSVPELPPVVLPKSPVKSPRKRVTRKSAYLNRTQADSVSTPAPTLPVAPARRGRKRKCADPPPVENANPEMNAQTPAAVTPPPVAVAPTPAAAPVVPSRPAATPTRGRGGRGARGRRRGSTRRNRNNIWDLMGLMCSAQDAVQNSIIYSIGNTDEYPDTLENVPLFSKKKDDAVVSLVEDADLSSSFAEENEEFSVKVYWQQSEYIKFNIRRFQKLSQIFDFFSKRESVTPDKLLFTLKGQILRPEDTPDSIDYNIALFIDGGIVNSSIANIASTNNSKENKTSSGILLKFQCQNVKKPFETYIELNQKLQVCMVKCAEHLELPCSKLRFMLDGESLAATSTPTDLGLDHGDCIDVIITS